MNLPNLRRSLFAAAASLALVGPAAAQLHQSALAVNDPQPVSIDQSFAPFGQRPDIQKVGEDGSSLIRDRNGVLIWSNKNGEPILLPNATIAKPLLVTNTECAVWNNRFADYDNYAEKPEAEVVIYRRSANGGTDILSAEVVPLQGKAVLETSPVTPVTYGFILVTTERFDNGAESVAIPAIGNPTNVDVWDGIRMRTYRLAWDGTVQRVGTFTSNIPKLGDDPTFDYLGYGSDGSMCYNLRIGWDLVATVADGRFQSDVYTYWIGEDTQIRQVPNIVPSALDDAEIADHIRAVYVSNERLLLVKFEEDRLNFTVPDLVTLVPPSLSGSINPGDPVLGIPPDPPFDGFIDPDDIINDYRTQVDGSIGYSGAFDYYADLAAPGGGPIGRILPLSLYTRTGAPIYAYSLVNDVELHLYEIGGTMEELGLPATLPINIGNSPTFVRNPFDASILLRSESNESGVIWVQSTEDLLGNVNGLDVPWEMPDTDDGLPMFVSNIEAVIWTNGTAELLGGGVIPPASISHFHVDAGALVSDVLTPPIFGNFVLNTPQVTQDPDGEGWFLSTFEKSTSDPRTAIMRTYRLILGLIDSDGDGLSDSDELLIGTNPVLPDTDGDGLPDGDEVYPFVVVDGLFTWEEARVLAGQAGGRLATPVDAATQTGLESRLAVKPGGSNYWIGGNDLLLEGDQNWVTSAGTVSFIAPEATYAMGSTTVNLSKALNSVVPGMRVYGPGLPTFPTPTVLAVDPTATMVTISAAAVSNQNLVEVKFAPPIGPFTNWAAGSPNNFDNADAVQVSVNQGFLWSSKPEISRQGYVVELTPTDPLNEDTDGDGVLDVDDRDIDTDGDGAPDWLEVEVLGTDPTIPDFGSGGGIPLDVTDRELMTSYDGLLFEVGIGVVGTVNVRISRRGTLTMKTTAFDDRATGRGTLNPTNGEAGFELRTSSRRSVYANLAVNRSAVDPTRYTVSGTLGTLTTVQQLFTLQPAAYKRGDVVTEAGNYTFAFLNPGPALASQGMPSGDGVGTTAVSRTGQFRARGYMADGSRFTFNGNVLLGKQVAFFVPLGSAWRPVGGAGGNLVFRNIANASDFDGYVRFVRQTSVGNTYQAGYDYFSQTVGNQWTTAGFSNYDEYGIDSTPNNCAMQFSGGVFSGQEVFTTLDSRARISTPRTQTRSLSARLNSRSGMVTGRYTYNDPASGYARTSAAINAVALPKLGEIRGQYTGGGDSGLWLLVPNSGGSLPPITQIAPRFQAIPEGGLAYKIYVTASEPWRVEIPPAVDWLFATPSSGNGNGEVIITVGRNYSELDRDGVILIAGLTHAVAQEHSTIIDNSGGSSVTINPSFRLVPPEGASYFVTVDADPPIPAALFDPLDYVSPVTWATVTPLLNTTTQQIIGAQVDVAVNPDPVPRFADLIIGGLVHRVDQQAAPDPNAGNP